ncbi:MAG: acetyl-CoA carboxylase carboxyl transferase subunit alpha, partial [Planctomycetes bacterium]|nr:acetyl-CoA carboxylase carboxyl transferase subunit alpha [Planctomycetota bacterium]
MSTTRNGLEFETPIVELETKIEELRTFAQSTAVDLSEQIGKLKDRCDEKKKAIFSNL